MTFDKKYNFKDLDFIALGNINQFCIYSSKLILSPVFGANRHPVLPIFFAPDLPIFFSSSFTNEVSNMFGMCSFYICKGLMP